jgi:hypothetical protein
MGDRRRRAGTEPVDARSPLGLRIVLSALFAPLFTAAAVGFAVAVSRADEDRAVLYAVLSAMCAVLAAVALADVVVLSRRRRGRQGPGARGRR